jgi:fatty-acid desaturase
MKLNEEASPMSQTGQVSLTKNWGTGMFLLTGHVLAIVALFYFSWPALIACVVLYWVSGSLGIGMGYHRLITHRSYKAPKLIEYFLVTCGTTALQGGPIQWVVTHRIHHAHTDQAGDPHTPRDGGWWAHIGWILWGTGRTHSEETLARYAPDLVNDRYYRWLTRFYFVPLLVTGILLFVFGGWSMMLWGVFLRVTLMLHSTWFVNSATHLWGRTRFQTGDDSRNSWWVALLTFGEGWHNNHHAHPTSARHGLGWYELDMNWLGIKFLEFFGLAHGVKKVRWHRVPLVSAPNDLRPVVAEQET